MAGTAVCDDGIVIDLSAMRAVSVDPVERTANVRGGALWGDVDYETQAHGLATTGGIVGHTGVGGLSLDGGIGWLMRKHGITVDNLVEAEVVTAEGDIVRASAQNELGTVIRLGTIPPLPVISDELHFRPAIAVACCFAGALTDMKVSADEHRTQARPWLGRPVAPSSAASAGWPSVDPAAGRGVRPHQGRLPGL